MKMEVDGRFDGPKIEKELQETESKLHRTKITGSDW